MPALKVSKDAESHISFWYLQAQNIFVVTGHLRIFEKINISDMGALRIWAQGPIVKLHLENKVLTSILPINQNIRVVQNFIQSMCELYWIECGNQEN